MPNAQRKVSKSKFSMYLRTQCDRELYLSLFSNKPGALKAAGLPIPLKARPNVELITRSGHEFEYEQYDRLILALPQYVVHQSNGHVPVDLLQALHAVTGETLILQPNIDAEDFRDIALENLKLTTEYQKWIPELSGLIPDVLYVHPAADGEYEVLPDGSRRPIAPSETRLGISVVDLKNVTEANASYSAEVCLYAFFLSNWLVSTGEAVKDQFFVSDRVYLWKHVEMPRFAKVISSTAGGDPKARLNALVEDLKDGLVNYLIFMPSVRKFFQEDLPRVVQQGDTEGWEVVPYHVNPRCSACDWLGHENWLYGDFKATFDANPTHYCSRNAKVSDHLSQIGSLSKGAAHILQQSGHSHAKHLVDIDPTAPVLRKHALLKKDRSQIGARASAIQTGNLSVDTTGRVGGLARNINVEYDVVVHFDAGSGFLTGIATRGVLFSPYMEEFSKSPDGTPNRFMPLGERAFVVPKDDLNAEWTAIQAFVEVLGQWIETAEKTFTQRKWGLPKTQICFWEERQYDELCNAFGRHLLRLLEMPSKFERALAWIFPAEQLMERDSEICPGLIFVRDVIDGSVRLPVRFTTTLLSAQRHYHLLSMPPRTVDRYYEEPLTSGIPRERIFEIWKSPTNTVKSYGKTISIGEAINRYEDVLKTHVWALGSVTARLRRDLKDLIEGNAPALSTVNPTGKQAVAYDSRLWSQWANVSTATTETEDRLGLIARAESLEASYKAIILTSLVTSLGNHRYEFEVGADSTEAKIEEGDGYCGVGIVSWPGFPLKTGKSLNLDLDNYEYKLRLAPMHKVVAATLETFDRANRRAVVRLRAGYAAVQPVFDALMDSGLLPIGKEPLYLLKGLSYQDLEDTERILEAIGNPKCAATSPEAIQAMGKAKATKLPKGTDSDTPIARILWDAKSLSSTKVRTPAAANAIRKIATTVNAEKLNPSQQDAVQACALNQLSVIWGPPGTGKTDTLVAMLHALVLEAGAKKNILVAGPNYRAVEELSERLLQNLNQDTKTSADVFWVYSRNREPRDLPKVGAHLSAHSVQLRNNSPELALLRKSLTDKSRTTIISTVPHNILKLTEQVTGQDLTPIAEIFDVVVLDESSQIDLVMALRPLTLLRPTGQLIIAGDQLQMPPIQGLDPPVGAEYLVGSIQTYLLHRFKIPTQDLLVNYRSNRDLVDFAKTLGYPRKLEAADPERQLHSLAPISQVVSSLPPHLPKSECYEELLVPERRVTALIHDDVVSSQANEFEARIVAGIAYCIRHVMSQEASTDFLGHFPFTDESFFKDGVGIVTPHKAQKALVVQELRTLFPDVDPKLVFEAVDTVERFQGGQRQTIIVSFGIGDVDVIQGEEEFLLQMERTNVAVSRAKSKCIVLMPKSLAYHLPTDQKAAQTAVAIKSYIEEFCANRKVVTLADGATSRGAEVRWH